VIFLLIISEDGQIAISEIYTKYFKRMLYTATKILGAERGEEAVHDVFVKIITRLEKNSDFLRDKAGQYFVIIVKNHCINLVKRENVEIFPLDDEILNEEVNINIDFSPEESLLSNETVNRLAAHIRELTPETRQVLEYRYIEGYSNMEIANILSISQSAVSSRLNRGKNNLKELLIKEGGDLLCV